MSKIIVWTRYFFEVDTSDEACMKFGFKHGERVVSPAGNEYIIMGVAPMEVEDDTSPEVLWYAEKEDGSGARNCGGPSLLDEGFQKTK